MVDNFVYLAYAEYLVIIAMFGYAGFWALNIRRALAVGIYRSQASGTGLLAAAIAATIVTVAADVTGNQFVILPAPLALAISSFYFIDASTQALRRSDPLLRDTLRWSRSRRYLWVVVFVLAVASALGNLEFSTTSKYYTPEAFVLTQSLFLFVFGIGAIIIPLGAVRSKDLTLKRHYKWFGSFLVFLLLFTVVAGAAPPINFLSETGFGVFVLADFEAASILMFMGAYSLYRSARSLAPLNRLVLGT